MNKIESQMMSNVSSSLNLEPKVAIIIVTWNKKDDVLECLASLRKLYYTRYRIFVVDNHSTDGSKQAIEKSFPGVKCIVNKENLGFTGGYNKGMLSASEFAPDYFFLLNNDIIVEPFTLSRLVQYMEQDSRIGIAGPQVLMYSNPALIWAAGGDISYWFGQTQHIFANQSKLSEDEPPFEVSYVPGCGMLISRKLFEQVGVFDNQFFAYSEDVDFCFRARQKAFKIVCVPASKIWHKASNSSENVTPLILYYYFRNKLLFIKKNISHKVRYLHYLSYLVNVFKIIIYILLGCIFKRKKQPFIKILAIIAGCKDYYYGKFGKRI